MIALNCKVCSKEFKVLPSALTRRYPAKFCSKKCMGISRIGNKHSEEVKLKLRLAHLGKPKSFEHRKNLSDSWKYRTQHPQTLETRQKIGASKVGRRRPDVSARQKGKNNPAWKGGVATSNQLARHSLDYKLWREAVFKRDNFTCQMCGTKKSPFNADHIKSFAHHKELRYAIDNGRTLCVPCHKKTPTYGNRKNIYESA